MLKRYVPHEWLHSVEAPVRVLFLGTPISVLDQGSHRPVLFDLEDERGMAGLWVVKACSSYPGSLGGPALLRELAGADLCAWVGLSAPAIGLLRFPEQTGLPSNESIPDTVRQMYERNAGRLAFCSRYLKDAPRLDRGILKRIRRNAHDAIRDALLLFALDVHLWNYDRARSNPNALWFRGRIVAHDHDTAFHRINAVDESGLSPDFAVSADLDAMSQHVAFPFVTKHLRSPVWEEFIDRINKLDERALEAMAARWPDELDIGVENQKLGYKSDLLRFLNQRRRHVRSLVNEVRDALA